jgi:hypothetical protein
VKLKLWTIDFKGHHKWDSQFNFILSVDETFGFNIGGILMMSSLLRMLSNLFLLDLCHLDILTICAN